MDKGNDLNIPADSDDLLIYDERWTNFDSEVLHPSQRSDINLNLNPITINPPHPVPAQNNNVIDLDGVNNNNNNLPTVHHDFQSCMEQVEMWSKRAKMAYKGRESASCNHENLLQQIRHRDELIQLLQNEIAQEKAARSRQVYLLERELYETGNLMNGYREQLKDVTDKFHEYKARVLHHMSHNNSDNATSWRSSFPNNQRI